MVECIPVTSDVESDVVAALEHAAGPPVARGCCVAVCTRGRARSLERLLASLTTQTRPVDQLVVVDAGTDDAAERVVARLKPAPRVRYFRVAGARRGLTRQRNFALRWVETDLVAFFDDDVVLLPRCLELMERAHRARGAAVAGVGAVVAGDTGARRVLWQARLRLGMVGDLRPGRYHRSGISTPWGDLPESEVPVEGDWLPGCAMMWRTAVAREVGYDEALHGYAQGEDLDFSLRARRRGALVVVPGARVLHLHEDAGRPDPYRLGYMAIRNRYRIHRRALTDRTWRDVAWFAYAWTLDTLLLAPGLVVPGRAAETARHIAGRLAGAYGAVREG